MSALKRIRDFKAAKDDTSADELRRQLVTFESNVSDMGDAVAKAAMQRLSARSTNVGIASTVGLVVAPGQFQRVDTRAGTVNVGLPKPTSSDAGTFIVLIDIGGGGGSIRVQSNGGSRFNYATTPVIVTVAYFATLIFCDGVDYWRLS